MKVLLALSFLAAAFANPLAEPNRLTADASQSAVCEILTNNLNCYYNPDTSSRVVRKFNKGNTVSFFCYQYGTCVTGGCTGATCGTGKCNVWDYSPKFDCFVSAHNTDSHCTTSTLQRCNFGN